MQVFKAFFKILNKNKMAMMIYTAIFFALTMILASQADENSVTSFSRQSLAIGADNQDTGELGTALVDYLELTNTIMEVPADHEALLDAMYNREIQYVLIIPEDFTEKFLAGEREEVLEGTEVPGNKTSYLAEMEIVEYLKTLGMYVDGGYGEKEAAALAMADMKKESSVEFLSSSDAEQAPSAYYYFQYLPYIFVCSMMVSLGAVLIAFNKKDLEARNRSSAMSFGRRNMQMILGSVVLMLIEYGVFMGMAFLLYPDFMGSVSGLLSALNALVYMLLSLSIAFFAGRLLRNSGELNMVANIVGLGFGFLGGVFVPLEYMSEGVKNVSKFVPSYWYVISNEKIWKLESLGEAGEVFRNMGVVAVFAVAVLAAALLVNRMRARTA